MKEEIWFKSYPKWVPNKIDTEKYNSLNEMFHACVEEYKEIPAYESFGKTITYDELDKLTDNFAAFLKNKGLKKGDKIAIQLPNILQYPIAMFGAIKAGLIIVNLNPLYTSPEMLEKFEDSGCKAIVIVANFAYKLEKVIAKTSIETVIVTGIGDMVGGFKGPFINFLLKYVKKSVKPYPKKRYIPFKEALKVGASNKTQEHTGTNGTNPGMDGTSVEKTEGDNSNSTPSLPCFFAHGELLYILYHRGKKYFSSQSP